MGYGQSAQVVSVVPYLSLAPSMVAVVAAVPLVVVDVSVGGHSMTFLPVVFGPYVWWRNGQLNRGIKQKFSIYVS